MSILTRALEETGLRTLWHSSRDVKLLCAQRFVRLFAYGGSTLILASYLSALEIPDDRIGVFMTLTLVGDVVISFLLTLFADAMGRKAVLALGSLLMTGSGVVFGLFGNFWILLVAAVLGVISPRCVYSILLVALAKCLTKKKKKKKNSGNEIGPFRAVEESTLAHLVPDEVLSDIFAWYSLGGAAGTALGMMICGWIVNVLVASDWGYIPACRVIFFVYAAVGVVKVLLNMGLSAKVEAESSTSSSTSEDASTEPLLNDRPEDRPQDRPRSILSIDRRLALTVGSLFVFFGLDSFASGLASLYDFFFFLLYGVYADIG